MCPSIRWTRRPWYRDGRGACGGWRSRSGAVKYTDQGLEIRLENLYKTGARILIETCDISDEAQVVALLERVRQTCGPLRVIVHSASVVDFRKPIETFGQSVQSTIDAVHRIWGPKSSGAWFLHKHTLEDKELDAFILYSSVSSLSGFAGQSIFSTTNAYVDSLAEYRVSLGLPAFSVQWPYILNVGYSTAMDKKGRSPLDQKISVGVVKRVFKKLYFSADLTYPVQAVLTGAFVDMYPRLFEETSKDIEWIRNEDKDVSKNKMTVPLLLKKCEIRVYAKSFHGEFSRF